MQPYRWLVLQNLKQAFQNITPANGFVNDLSNSVYVGRSILESSDGAPVPQISILEPPINDSVVKPLILCPKQQYELILIIQGITDSSEIVGKQPTEDAYVLLAEVKKVLGNLMSDTKQGKKPLHPSVTDIAVSPGVVRPTDELSSYDYFWLPISIKIVEDMRNAFSS